MPETEPLLSKKAQKKALKLEKIKAQNKANRKLKKQLAQQKEGRQVYFDITRTSRVQENIEIANSWKTSECLEGQVKG